MKKLFAIETHGKKREWEFLFYGDDKYLQEWQEDGLRIDEVVNVIPQWIVGLGLLRIWCWIQERIGV
jgi:hypothetical protein